MTDTPPPLTHRQAELSAALIPIMVEADRIGSDTIWDRCILMAEEIGVALLPGRSAAVIEDFAAQAAAGMVPGNVPP